MNIASSVISHDERTRRQRNRIGQRQPADRRPESNVDFHDARTDVDAWSIDIAQHLDVGLHHLRQRIRPYTQGNEGSDEASPRRAIHHFFEGISTTGPAHTQPRRLQRPATLKTHRSTSQTVNRKTHRKTRPRGSSATRFRVFPCCTESPKLSKTIVDFKCQSRPAVCFRVLPTLAGFGASLAARTRRCRCQV